MMAASSRTEERLANLEMLVRGLSVRNNVSGHNGTSTNAQWVKHLKETQVLQRSAELSLYLMSKALSVWPTDNVPTFPKSGDDESTVCQPFVTERIIELLARRATCTMFPLGARTTMPHTPAMGGRMTSVSFVSTPVDSHAVVSFANRKPDITCYLANESGPSAITFLGEVKGCGSTTDEFSDEEVGHVLDMATSLLLKEQFHRSKLLCFLTDGVRFQVFALRRPQRSDKISYSSSTVFMRTTGWQIFIGLLTMSAEELGLQRISVPGYTIQRGLGYGKFCDVYACRQTSSAATTETNLCVMKVFLSEFAPLVATEATVLRALRTTVAADHVPRLLSHLDTPTHHVLIMTPIGVPILPCARNLHVTPAMRMDLLNVVRAAHDLGWIHRDIKPQNIFVDEHDFGRIVLNDWNCAARMGQSCPFAGTVSFADRPDRNNHHIPCPATDLCALVRTLFCVAKQQLPWTVDDEWDTVEAYWSNMERVYPSLQTAMRFASEANYDGLGELFRQQW